MKIEEEEVEVHLFCFVHLFIVSGSVYRAFKEEGTTSIFHRLSVIKMKKVNFEDLIPKNSPGDIHSARVSLIQNRLSEHKVTKKHVTYAIITSLILNGKSDEVIINEIVGHVAPPPPPPPAIYGASQVAPPPPGYPSTYQLYGGSQYGASPSWAGPPAWGGQGWPKPHESQKTMQNDATSLRDVVKEEFRALWAEERKAEKERLDRERTERERRERDRKERDRKERERQERKRREVERARQEEERKTMKEAAEKKAKEEEERKTMKEAAEKRAKDEEEKKMKEEAAEKRAREEEEKKMKEEAEKRDQVSKAKRRKKGARR
ncbi:uncharacterized protein [Bemisia tabaci]|uniref:uncharacterized protein isoform X2 n=1 Tax=Bemisia tabaci TaxID=7038 RepID=UPI003B27FED5